MDKWRRRRRGGKVGIMFSERRRGKEEGGEREREREREGITVLLQVFLSAQVEPRAPV